MPALAGLSGLYGTGKPAGMTDVGVLESRAIPGGLDPMHSHPGDTTGEAYPAGFGAGYKATAYGPDVEVDSQTGEFYDSSFSGGQDRTPSSHSSSWPRGIIQDSYDTPGTLALVNEQMRIPHAIDKGAVNAYTTYSPVGREIPAHYTTDRYDAPNATVLSTTIPGQLRSSSSGGQAAKDSVQALGALNDLPEFQMGHSIRRVQHDTLHWDYSTLHGGPRPFYPRTPVVQPAFDGPDSPYGPVQGGIDGSFAPDRTGGATFPTPYPPIPDPTVAASYTDNDSWAY